MSNTNNVVKIKSSHYGEKYINPKWCLIDPANLGGTANLCGGEYFGGGESSCDFETKIGKVTCQRCIEKIKIYHTIKI